MNFGTLAQIDPGRPESWRGKLFLCFDIDWAADDVLADSIDLVEKAGIAATWFVTHGTPLLPRLRANSSFELAIHPNFNRLLFDSDSSNGRSAQEIVGRLLGIVPEARSVRSHSVTQSSRLIEEFSRNGLTHHSNSFIPWDSGLPLKPWRLWNGMTEVPYGWADDAHFVYGWGRVPSFGRSEASLQVATFHPVHVFINSAHSKDYENCREHLHQPASLISRRRAGEGARAWLESILAA